MITVRMIQYWNDYYKKEVRKHFKDLKELEDWVLGQMRVDYSSGYRAGQKPCTKLVRKWLAGCGRRKNVRNAGEDMVSGRVIMKAAKRIYDAGGCGAEDEYSEGYDNAINVALDILLEETGYTVDEILSYDEDGEG